MIFGKTGSFRSVVYGCLLSVFMVSSATVSADTVSSVLTAAEFVTALGRSMVVVANNDGQNGKMTKARLVANFSRMLNELLGLINHFDDLQDMGKTQGAVSPALYNGGWLAYDTAALLQYCCDDADELAVTPDVAGGPAVAVDANVERMARLLLNDVLPAVETIAATVVAATGWAEDANEYRALRIRLQSITSLTRMLQLWLDHRGDAKANWCLALLATHTVVTLWEFFRDLRDLNKFNPEHDITRTEWTATEGFNGGYDPALKPNMYSPFEAKRPAATAGTDTNGKPGEAQEQPLNFPDSTAAWNEKVASIMARPSQHQVTLPPAGDNKDAGDNKEEGPSVTELAQRALASSQVSMSDGTVRFDAQSSMAIEHPSTAPMLPLTTVGEIDAEARAIAADWQKLNRPLASTVVVPTPLPLSVPAPTVVIMPAVEASTSVAMATPSTAASLLPATAAATIPMVHAPQSPVVTVPLRLTSIAEEASGKGAVSTEVKRPVIVSAASGRAAELKCPEHFLTFYQETHDGRSFEDDLQSDRVHAERYWRAWRAVGGTQSSAVTADAVAGALRRQASAQSLTLRQTVLARRPAMHGDDDVQLQAAIDASLHDSGVQNDSGARIEE